MKIGIVCYASVGGSGIVATELAKALAARGHDVHLVSSEPPFRLRGDAAGVTFHRVETPAYPLFREPQYLISLATRLVHVCLDVGLDVLHAHYAVPHATAAYLARQILRFRHEAHVPRVVATLHGTDITLVGSDPSYTEAVAFSIDEADAVTAVSESLKVSTVTNLPVRADIRVIHNFLDCGRYRRHPDPDLRERLCPADEYDALVVHLSNFRPVKRVEAVVQIFRQIRRHVRAKLVLAGEGPDAVKVQEQVRDLCLEGDVELLPPQETVVPLLSSADLFLLPSLEESFGLAALEAMACGVPVVASRVGGLPEVVDHGRTGFLLPPDRLDEMAEAGTRLLLDRGLHERIATAAREEVLRRFCADVIVPQYERLYEGIVARPGN